LRKALVVMTELYPTKEALDAAGTGAQEATHETFAQLDELLAGVIRALTRFAYSHCHQIED
jgi:hypothetical protein